MPRKKYDIFKAIADPSRRKIISLLTVSGALSITAIASDFKLSRQVVTRHINKLEQAGLVQIEDAGRERYCRVEFGPLKEVFDWVSFYEKFWDEKLNSLEAHLLKKN
ncbi:transcriptional regulator [Cytophagales bacterium WSM2-2]|nr:transcriptional regulator [Cytophagales bacterium WSM2-2]